MRLWRALALGTAAVLAGWPLVLPFWNAAPELPSVWSDIELERLVSLCQNTLLLVTGTLLLALPLGTALAILVFRTDVPARPLFLAVALLALFIPLPVLASAWQATLGPGSWQPFILWQPRAGQPWTEGIVPAALVHGLAAVPWVTVIVAPALLAPGTPLEEEASLAAGPWRVLWSVTLPRCRPALIVAALLVAVQAAGEVSVTDMFLVRTFAEEIYRLLGEGSNEVVGRVVLLSLLPAALLGMLVMLARRSGIKIAIPQRGAGQPAYRFRLGRWRWIVLFLAAGMVLSVAAVPLLSLAWRAGVSGNPPRWTASEFTHALARALLVNGKTVVESFLLTTLAAAISLLWALVICGCVRGADHKPQRLGKVFFVVLFLLWALPGPLLGLGLKQLILLIVVWMPWSGLAGVLYYGPSPLPLLWAYVLRCLPLAAAVIWWAMAATPRDLHDAAALDGASRWRALWWVELPRLRPALICAGLVCLALALSEVSAARLAATPGVETFTLVVFDRMHYGVAQEVAALCLLLLLCLGLMGVEVFVRLHRLQSSRRHF